MMPLSKSVAYMIGKPYDDLSFYDGGCGDALFEPAIWWKMLSLAMMRSAPYSTQLPKLSEIAE